MWKSAVEILKFHINVSLIIYGSVIGSAYFLWPIIFLYYLYVEKKVVGIFCFQTLKIEIILVCYNDKVVRESCSGWLWIFRDCFTQWQQ